MLYSSLLAVSLLVPAADPALPEIERDFTRVSPTKKADQTLATLIPPDSISRIILMKGETKKEIDHDELIAQAFKSSTKGRDWGLLASERTASEFILVTKKGDIYRVEVVSDFRRKGAMSALLVYGKGFSCRYDLAKKDDPLGK